MSATVAADPRPSRDAARAAAVAVFVVFVLNGFTFATWAARLPTVQASLGLGAAQIGLLLLVGSAGAVAALPLSGVAVHRLGTARTVSVFSVAATAGMLVAATGVATGSVPLAVVGLFAQGAGIGVWDAAMNLEGAAVEQALGRAVMPRFHAGFSFGTMAGAGIGAVVSALDVAFLPHVAAAIVVGAIGVLLAARRFLPHRPDGVDTAPPVPAVPVVPVEPHQPVAAATGPAAAAAAPMDRRRRAALAWTEPRTLLIGVVVLAAALTEGSANDWVGIAFVRELGTSESVGALAFGVFVTAMTAMRLVGTALLDRYGRVAVLRLSAVTALLGLGLFALSPASLGLTLPLLGVVAWGFGAALGFPVGMSAASDDPESAPFRLAVVSTIGYTAFLAGPPLLGLLAHAVGYRSALLVIAVPAVAGLLVARVARPLPVPAAVPVDAPGARPGPERPTLGE